MKFKPAVWLLMPLIIVAIFLFFALFNISTPGFHYDEVLFVNAARGGYLDGFVASKIGRITLFLMAYIGGLKSLLYMPIFFLLGVSYETIRIPMVILAVSSVVVFSWFLYRQYDKQSAFVYLFLSLLNPAIIFQSRLDIGPSVIEFVITQIVLGLFILYTKTQKLMYLLVLPIFLAIGTYNKLNFIWIANAFVAVIFLSSWRNFLSFLKEKKFGQLGAFFVSFSMPYLLFIFVSLKFHVSNTYSLAAVVSTIGLKVQNAITTITGTGFIRFHFLDIPFWVDVLILGILLAPLFSILLRQNEKLNLRRVMQHIKHPGILFSVGLILLLVFAQIIITTQAIATWHTAQLLVFWNFSLSLLFVRVMKISWQGVVLSLVSLGIVWSVLSASTLYHFNNPKLFIWAPAIDTLATFTKSSSERVNVLDWGIYNQLIIFDYTPHKYSEEFWTIDHLSDEEFDAYIQAHYLTEEGMVFVFHSASRANPNSTAMRVLRSLEKYGYTYSEEEVVMQGDQAVFEVVRVVEK
ncbi:MAG: hypothetical protein QY314_01355 [Candidatus Dojkabacteria bacterium]|nr:MAG: hypothetical protein QY314_01355 [Candidatus Dojkabacteria bacterium]